ncbi:MULTISPECIES: sulfite exporter TauE/SafE family protein [Rheinheimera]|uniref:Probable membrane transporter protein n=1 Tax=Rheinheimera marina TaxID=1774958 RepID=A0ABV9JMZ1_9GAMM
MTIWVLLAALIIGAAVGLLGSGGSILTVPVLLHMLKLPEKVAIAASLGVVGQISLIALIPYLLRKRVPLDLLKRFVAPALAGTVSGTWLSGYLSADWQLLVLAALMLLSALNMWQQKLWQWPISSGWALAAVAFTLGGLTGLVGVGGGFLIVPLLLTVTSLPLVSAVACSLALICLQSWLAFAGHSYLLQQQGIHLPWSSIFWLGGLGAVGSLAGVLLSEHLPQQLLKRVFAVVLLLLAGSLFFV